MFLGDHSHCKELLPDPKAAIFLADFNHDTKKLAEYLKTLINNEAAYERHRSWRIDFDIRKHLSTNKHLMTSWHCRYSLLVKWRDSLC